tara:strand:- start:1047 stop:1499 length:453 start_codon:yes stop_codon:yes gene_type:complete
MKKIFLLFIIILLAHCNYKPIYSQDKQNFHLKIIELNKNRNNKILENRLNNYGDKNSALYFYELKIRTSENKSIISKNTEGDPTILRLKLILDIEIFENKKILSKKVYSEQFDYQNMSKKFELNNYENEIRNDSYNNMISKILIDLTNLK